MTYNEKKTYVESKWNNRTAVWFGKPLGGEFKGCACYTVQLNYSHIFQGATEEDAWSKAYDFTVQREREIALLEFDITVLKDAQVFAKTDADKESFERSIACLQPILNMKKEGFTG